MSEIRVAIAGEGAIPATEALLKIDGISGSYQRWEEVEKEGVNAVVATIAGIPKENSTMSSPQKSMEPANPSRAIATQIRRWYLEYKQKKSGEKIAKVLFMSANGERLLLENATIEDINSILSA
ncbi:MAG: hypothetical protein ACFB02_09470 [Mastigocoleus sp.]